MIAHQGGWDEILLVLGPLAVFAWLLVLANRRANRIADERSAMTPSEGTEATTGDRPPSDDLA